MSDQQVDPQDAARKALLTGIAEGAKNSSKLNPGNQATALKELAEAYAWTVAANNSH